MSLVPCLFPTIICTWHPITFRSDGEWYGDLRHLGSRCPGRNRLSRCRRALLCVLLQDFFSRSKMDFSRGEDLVVFHGFDHDAVTHRRSIGAFGIPLLLKTRLLVKLEFHDRALLGLNLKTRLIDRGHSAEYMLAFSMGEGQSGGKCEYDGEERSVNHGESPCDN